MRNRMSVLVGYVVEHKGKENDVVMDRDKNLPLLRRRIKIKVVIKKPNGGCNWRPSNG